MKKVITLGLCTALVALSAMPVQAKTTLAWERTLSDTCYQSKFVPGTVEYNTKGKLAYPASEAWVGNHHKDGAIVRHARNGAVYYQTRKVLEEEHYTLVKVACK